MPKGIIKSAVSLVRSPSFGTETHCKHAAFQSRVLQPVVENYILADDVFLQDESARAAVNHAWLLTD